MSERKIIPPDDMIEAVMRRHISRWDSAMSREQVEIVLVAALTWLAENPLMPTPNNISPLLKAASLSNNNATSGIVTSIVRVWQQTAFLAPEPVIPEEIKDLLLSDDYRPLVTMGINERIAEAFRRGQKAGK